MGSRRRRRLRGGMVRQGANAAGAAGKPVKAESPRRWRTGYGKAAPPAFYQVRRVCVRIAGVPQLSATANGETGPSWDRSCTGGSDAADEAKPTKPLKNGDRMTITYRKDCHGVVWCYLLDEQGKTLDRSTCEAYIFTKLERLTRAD